MIFWRNIETQPHWTLKQVFAWRPLPLEDEDQGICWLETVWRFTYYYGNGDYSCRYSKGKPQITDVGKYLARQGG